ncbi:MAG: hypothetical protein ACKESB_01110 [Candidatus Hodgkinia cicadicola]
MSNAGEVKVATSHNMCHLPPLKLISSSINLNATWIWRWRRGGREVSVGGGV